MPSYLTAKLDADSRHSVTSKPIMTARDTSKNAFQEDVGQEPQALNSKMARDLMVLQSQIREMTVENQALKNQCRT